MTIVPPFAAYSGDQPYAFVSYAHADSHLVYPLITDLHEQGYRIWYDDGIAPTEPWSTTLADTIAACRLYIVFVTKVSVEREGVDLEIGCAHKHRRPILAVCLEETPLPTGIDFLIGSPQHLTYQRRDHDEWIAAIRATLDGVDQDKIAFDLRGEPNAVEILDPPPVDLGPRPPRSPRRLRPKAVSEAFVDRIGESEALAISVARQRRRLTGVEPPEEGVFPNVLVFHGGGGVGKSGLSERLEAWLRGSLADAAEWGSRPHTDAEVIPVRWDFNDSVGNLDMVVMLQAVRSALAGTDHAWCAFDVALAAYLEAVGDTSAAVLSGPAADGVLRSLQIVAAQLKQSPPMALTGEDIRRIAGRVRTSSGRQYSLAGNTDLVHVLDSIRELGKGQHAPAVVADLMYLLNDAIYDIEPERRPALVFFLDHFENIQRSDAAGADATIASFVMELPYALFVVTGRDRLNWDHPARTDLAVAGPAAWPGLVPGVLTEPRQHVLERLSDEDTRRLYEHYRSTHNWTMSDDLIEVLVARSDGLPLHIGAVIKLAQTTVSRRPGAELTAEQLDGDLPHVVDSLLRVLTREEARAFRAACVLPSFDIELAAAVGKVDGGDVERAITFALVESSASEVYPYRVHDEIRKLVKRDRDSNGYWATGDWHDAARRGLDEAMRRIRAGHRSGSDDQQMQGIALAIRLAYEWELYPPGLADVVYDAPSMSALAPLIPTAEAAAGRGDITALIEFIHALSARGEDSLAAMREIRTDNPEIAFRIDTWTVIRLRTIRKYDEAIALSEEIIGRYPERQTYLWHQYAITLRMARRFRDAIDSKREHAPDGLARFQVGIDRGHGIADTDPSIAREYVRQQTSRRLQGELRLADLLAEVRFVGIDVDDVQRRLAEAVQRGARVDARKLLDILAYAMVTDRDELDRIIARIRELVSGRSIGIAGPLALRALYTRDPADIDAAVAEVSPASARGLGWIPVEVWLAEVGHPVQMRETQWIVPYEEVRRNWLRAAEGMFERSKGYVAERVSAVNTGR